METSRVKKSIVEGLQLADDDVYNKVQTRHRERKSKLEERSTTTIHTLLAIRDVQLRKKIVARRLRRLKRTIYFLFCLSFMVSWFYFYILYLIYSKPEMTLGMGIVDRHVRGTTQLEAGLHIWLFLIGLLRLKCPKKEGLYYLTQISYLFAVIHYTILIPLHARNFVKFMINLETLMEDEMNIGRCNKVEVEVPSPSNYVTYAVLRESKGKNCIISKKNMKLPHIRPVTQTECDGHRSWYRKAMTFALVDNLKDSENLDNNTENINYEGYSVTFANSQREKACCGITSFKDWERTRAGFFAGKPIDYNKFVYPVSCCKESVMETLPGKNCLAEAVHGGTCTSHERVTVIAYSLGVLVVLIICGIFNFTIFIFLTKLRNMVERFRPDLLER